MLSRRYNTRGLRFHVTMGGGKLRQTREGLRFLGANRHEGEIIWRLRTDFRFDVIF